MENRSLMDMIYELSALGNAISTIAEQCDPDSSSRENWNDAMSLIYLLSDLAHGAKELAEATLACPDSNLERVRAENEQLRRMVVDLRLQISG